MTAYVPGEGQVSLLLRRDGSDDRLCSKKKENAIFFKGLGEIPGQSSKNNLSLELGFKEHKLKKPF